MGGQFRLRSEPNEGTQIEFTVYLSKQEGA